jgi:large subunit ribosomal protein L4
MEAPLYNQKGDMVGKVALSDALFGVRWSPTLVHETVLQIQANRRQAIAHVKDRGDVRGGGKKPWRQKGTGRARHGSTRSPLWVGGGVTHGPSKDKNFTTKINKNARRKALAAALSRKLKDGEVIFVDTLATEKPKTREAVAFLKTFGKAISKENLGVKGGRALILTAKSQPEIVRAFRNLPYVQIMEARNINVEEALLPKYLLFTKDAVATIAR